MAEYGEGQDGGQERDARIPSSKDGRGELAKNAVEGDSESLENLNTIQDSLEMKASLVEKDLRRQLLNFKFKEDEFTVVSNRLERKIQDILDENINEREKLEKLTALREEADREFFSADLEISEGREEGFDLEDQAEKINEEQSKVEALELVKELVELKKEIADCRKELSDLNREIVVGRKGPNKLLLKRRMVGLINKYGGLDRSLVDGGLRLSRMATHFNNEAMILGGGSREAYKEFRSSLDTNIERLTASLKGVEGEVVRIGNEISLIALNRSGVTVDERATFERQIDRSFNRGEIDESARDSLLAKLAEIPEKKPGKKIVRREAEDVLGKSRMKILDELRQKKLNTPEAVALNEELSKDNPDFNEIIRLAMFLEGDTVFTSEVVEVLEIIPHLEKWHKYASEYASYSNAVESQLGPEKQLEDPKRAIILFAFKRIKEGRGPNEVTEEDIQGWVKERLALVIGGSGESTGYYVRQFLGQMAGILGERDLGFDILIAQDKANISSGEDEDSYDGLYKEAVNGMKGVGGDHAKEASNDFKDLINASLVMWQLGQAYDHSGNAEDMIRPMAAAETGQISWALELEEVRKNITGHLQFYEVELDGLTKQRKTLSTGDFGNTKEDEGPIISENLVSQLHTAELNKGGVSLEIVKRENDEPLVIGPSDLMSMLEVEADEVGVKVDDIFNFLNQKRFAAGVMSNRDNVSAHFGVQARREAVMFNLGLINIDGEIQVEAIQRLAEKKYGDGCRIKFFKDEEGGRRKYFNRKDIRKKLRVKMAISNIGNKPIEIVNDAYERQEFEYKDANDEPQKMSVLFGGLREKSTDVLENEYKMAFVLAKGMWDFTGLSIAHHNKDHKGRSKDWHLKILNFIEYVMKYGIGPGHIREHVSLNYGDFITQRSNDLFPELFGSHTKRTTKTFLGKEKQIDKNSRDIFDRGNLIRMLMSDRDGIFMSRETFLNILEHYREFGDGEGGENKAGDEFIKSLLLEKAQYEYGEIEGIRVVNKHWQDIKSIDWTKVIADGKGGLGDLSNDGEATSETKGFNGLYWWIKKNYTYGNLKWGRGGHPTDETWGQRLFKEAQYLFSAEKFRGAILGWMAAGGITSPNKMFEAIGTPGYYGTADNDRKTTLFFTKWREWVSRPWEGFWKLKPLWGLETVEVNPETNATVNSSSDLWDNSRRYGKEKVLPGVCLAKRDRNLGPYSNARLGEVIDQAQRDGKLTPGRANRLRGDTEELGLWASWLNMQLDGQKGGVFLKPVVGLLFGFDIRAKKIGDLVIIRNMRFPGILGWSWKKIWKLISDTWSVKGEMLQGVGDETVKQAGGIFKS
jgi:hypothetical protein